MGGRGGYRPFVGNALHGLVPGGQQVVGPVFDPARGVGVGRAAVRRIVFEAAVFRRIMGRGDDNAVGKLRGALAIAGQDGMGDDRRRGIAETLLEHHLHAVGCEHLEGGYETRFREGMGVHAEKEGSGDPLGRPIFANGLGCGEDVSLVEAPCQAMSHGVRKSQRPPAAPFRLDPGCLV